jgi:hypothetical protein
MEVTCYSEIWVPIYQTDYLHFRGLFLILKLEVTCYFEIWVPIYQTIQHLIPEDSNHHNHIKVRYKLGKVKKFHNLNVGYLMNQNS